MASSSYWTGPTTVLSAVLLFTTTTARWLSQATLPTRWQSSDGLRVPSSSTAMSLLTATMPSHFGHQRVTACTTTPTSTCAVRVLTSSVHEAGATPHAAVSWVIAVPSSGTTDGATSRKSWSSPTLISMPSRLPS